MQFSIGDKVVHPNHGPGRITGVETCQWMDKPEPCYVLEMPEQSLKVFVPISSADELGMRRAMSKAQLDEVVEVLRSEPDKLADGFKERQEAVALSLRTRDSMTLARTVRDLTWHTERARPTQKDRDLLRQGRDLLAAEVALVSGKAVSESSRWIASTLAAVIADHPA